MILYLISFISTSYIILDYDFSIQFEIAITKLKVKLMMQFEIVTTDDHFTVKTKQSTIPIFSLHLMGSPEDQTRSSGTL